MRDSQPKPQAAIACPPRDPGTALRDYGLAELATAMDALANRGRHVHHGVHLARKAIRRTRAMLALGKPVLGPGARLIDHQLRDVNRRMSSLRDAHALVETLVRDVPPRKLATFYLDSAQPVVEDVTEGVLRTALRRTLDGIHRLIQLQVEDDPPVKKPGMSCRWCPYREECTEGRAYLRGDDDEVEP